MAGEPVVALNRGYMKILLGFAIVFLTPPVVALVCHILERYAKKADDEVAGEQTNGNGCR